MGENAATMRAEGRFAVGVDVGGTKVAAGLVDLGSGALMHRRSEPTRSSEGGAVVLDQAIELAAAVFATAHASEGAVVGIGVSLCELVDASGAVTSGQAVNWVGQPVFERFTNLAPTVIEADVRAHALAEAHWGAGRGSRQFVFVSVGTGISSCLVLDGVPYAGARGNALVLASQAASLPCPRCGNTHWPSLEDYASGPALAGRYAAATGRPVSRAEEVLAADDALAREIVESGGQALGARLGLLVDVLDPERIVVGGGLGSVDGPYWNSLTTATRAHIWAEAGRGLPIVHAQLGPDAALCGAALAIGQRVANSVKQEQHGAHTHA